MGVEMKRLDTVRKSDGQECSIYRRNAANERARNINLIPFFFFAARTPLFCYFFLLPFSFVTNKKVGIFVLF